MQDVKAKFLCGVVGAVVCVWVVCGGVVCRGLVYGQ